LLSIATICQHSAFQLVSLNEKPITRAEELKGKTVGIVSVGGTTDMFLDLILAKVGLQKEDVRREPVGDNPGAIEFVRRARIDCFICSLNTVVAIERAGIEIQYWSTDRYAPMPGQIYQTTKDIAAGKPDLVRAYLRAMKASVDELINEPIAPIFRRAAKDFDIAGLADMDSAVAVQKATEDRLWLSEGKQNLLRNLPPLFAAGVQTLRQGGVADIADPTSLYTNQFIDEVLKG
jgi:ABC-type nitrate/sulfonate/bicarbonate transport system substrate-binding protein